MGILKNAVKISIEYDQLITQAMRLEKAADTCGEGGSRLLRQLNELLSHWQGEAAEAMFLKLTELYKGSIALQRELQEKATQLRQIAEAIKWADDSTAAEIRGSSGRF